MDTPPTQPQRRRKRQRASEGGNTANPSTPGGTVAVPSVSSVPWGQASHAHSARPNDTVQQPTFPSQQLDTSHQVPVAVAASQPDGLMNGYGTPHAQYPEPTPSFVQPSAVPPQQHQPPPLPVQQQPDPLGNRPQNTATPGRPPGANSSKTDNRVLYQQPGAVLSGATAAGSPATVANTPPAGRAFGTSGSGLWNQNMPQSPAPGGSGPNLQPPPEGIYRTFEDLLEAVQKAAKDQGYGIVKLRASNYREGKATRYDLVCDRGGVKYNSTAKKRNPSTRKIDCPFRAKAVCEVQLSNQWRFVVQDPRHNHEARVGAAMPGQENTPIAQSVRSMTNKLDRMQHDMSQGFQKLEASLGQRLENIEKRLDHLEAAQVAQRQQPPMMGGGGPPNLGAPSMPPAAMGGPTLGGGGLTNGGMPPGTMVDNRLNNIEARVSGLEHRGMEGLQMMEDETGQLTMMVRP